MTLCHVMCMCARAGLCPNKIEVVVDLRARIDGTEREDAPLLPGQSQHVQDDTEPDSETQAHTRLGVVQCLAEARSTSSTEIILSDVCPLSHPSLSSSLAVTIDPTDSPQHVETHPFESAHTHTTKSSPPSGTAKSRIYKQISATAVGVWEEGRVRGWKYYKFESKVALISSNAEGRPPPGICVRMRMHVCLLMVCVWYTCATCNAWGERGGDVMS